MGIGTRTMPSLSSWSFFRPAARPAGGSRDPELGAGGQGGSFRDGLVFALKLEGRRRWAAPSAMDDTGAAHDHALDHEQEQEHGIGAPAAALEADGHAHGPDAFHFEDVVLQPRTGSAVRTDPGRGIVRPTPEAGTLADGVLPDSGSVGSRPAVPLSQTFLLESNPNSSKTIFLDFDGASLTGTAWNSSNLPNGWAPAFTLDTDTSTNFSTAELTAIQDIFFRVAADYAPFDVNVTLRAPTADKITRSSSSDLQYGTVCLFSNIADQTGHSGAGGVAYVGVFDYVGNTYKPALVFPNKLGNSAKNIAEAASHEIGHNLNLGHDGTSTAGYYTGFGNSPGWAPIMGVGYYKNLTQFSRGEYADANNTENDFSRITGEGVSYYIDTEGDTFASALNLSFSLDRNSDGIYDWASVVGSIDLKSSTGLSSTGAYLPDRDLYSFYLPAAGDLSINVANGLVYSLNGAKTFDYLPTGWGNLRADALLYSADGSLVADWSANAQVDVTNFAVSGLGSGSYVLAVQANASSPDGESVWGSLGHYQLNLDYTATGPVGPQSPTYALKASVTSVNEGGSVSFTTTTTGVEAGTVLTWTVSGVSAADLVDAQTSGSFTVAADGTAAASLGLLADLLSEGAETLSFTVYDAAGVTALAPAASVVVNDTSKPDLPLTLWGTTGSDVITGGGSNDRLAGVLATGTRASAMGRSQIDTITGGLGADTFLLADARGTFYTDGNSKSAGATDYVLIKDFNMAEGDKLQLRNGSQYWSRDLTGSTGPMREIYLADSLAGFGVGDELVARLEGNNFANLSSTPVLVADPNQTWTQFV